ncbi:MAG: ABC transporter ATP-binding protein [Gammaproteobacteria bacterium]|nr:ABC transporter ATP-binding protein [Gammaproteobacteria bacterium]
MTSPADQILMVDTLGKQVSSPEGNLTILDGVSFTVARGESVAIVGASGSGKSTLLGLMAGLDVPSSGDVSIAGQALGELDEDGRAALRADRVGFVFQSFHLLPALTALENVMLPLELAEAANPRQRAEKVLEEVGLGERTGHYPNQLSGGEQQRVAIARAFATEPEILFADEPTGSLDTRTGDTIIDLLFDLNRSRGTTLVLVTHDDRLADRCDRVLSLDAGRLETAA